MYDLRSRKFINEIYTSSLWVVRARFYYLFFAYLLVVVSIPKLSLSTSLIPVTIIFVLSNIFNLFLSIYLYKNNKDNISEIRLWRINVAQVVIDLLYIYLLLALSGVGLSSLVQIFFLIPIIVSMMFFGGRGAVAVSVISGVFLFFSAFNDSGILIALLKNPSAIPKLYIQGGMNLKLAQTGVVSVIYLLVALFSGSISKLLLMHESEIQKRYLEEESSVKKLSALTKDFELSSKLLVRRDIELTMANEKMHDLDLMKNEIISVAAHQLRSPLSGIKWMIKMLLNEEVGKLTEEQKNWLERGYDSNERLIKTVNDLLEIDRLESGRIKYTFSLCDISSIIKKVISELSSKSIEKNIHISFEDGGVPKLYLDSERISDLFENIIDNAIKYSKLNSIVVVTTSINGDNVRISVTDNGIGISQKDKSNIFSKFFRTSAASSYNTEGTGLGLSIAKNIVSRHGGEISFISKENEVTTFYIDLPLSLKDLENHKY